MGKKDKSIDTRPLMKDLSEKLGRGTKIVLLVEDQHGFCVDFSDNITESKANAMMKWHLESY